MKMRPISKLLFLFITIFLFFVSMFVLIDRTYENIDRSSKEVAIYNDSILSVKDKFNQYLILDNNINIYKFDKSKYISDTNEKLDSLNKFVKSDDINKLANDKEDLVNSLVIKNYTVKESYGVVNYEISKGFIFKSKKIKQIYYKKIDKKEIDKLNKTERLNKTNITIFNKTSEKINLKLNEIVVKKINHLQEQKHNVIKYSLTNSNNNFYLLVVIMVVTIITIILFLVSIIKDIILIMKKNELDKVTLSFLVDFIRKN